MIEQKRNDLADASKTLKLMIQRVSQTKTKFEEGSSQHSLQQNRLHALNLSLSLINRKFEENPIPLELNQGDLKRAIAPIESLIRKSEKAKTKLNPGSWQDVMLSENLKALRLVLPLLQEALKEKNNGLE